jgi:hypothetical protein
VITLLADANVEGHVARLVVLMQSDYWRELWDYLEIRVVPLHEVGLAPESSDAQVWQYCQAQRVYLLTNNRNDAGPDSLEAVIRTCSTPASLPVFTFGDADQILRDTAYAERVIESLFDNLFRAASLLGTGRVYLP